MSDMPQFFFHFRDETGLHLDELGCEFPDMETAYLEAFAGAKGLWTEMLHQKRDPRTASFEVTDSAGHVLFDLPFSEVLTSAAKLSCKVESSTAIAAQRYAQRVVILTEKVAQEIQVARQKVEETRKLLVRSTPGAARRKSVTGSGSGHWPFTR